MNIPSLSNLTSTLLLACALFGSVACGGAEGDDTYDTHEEADQAAVGGGGATGSSAGSTERRNGTTGHDIAGSNVCKFQDGTSLICCAHGSNSWYYENNVCAFCGIPDCHDNTGRLGNTTRVLTAR